MNVSDNSTGNQSSVPFPPEADTSALIVFLSLQQCVFILSFSGNLVVIIVVLKYLKLNTFSNQMVVSLAVTDLCTGFASGSQLLYVLFPVMDQNKVSCFLRYRIVVTMTLASQLSLVFSTLDRLTAWAFLNRVRPAFETSRIRQKRIKMKSDVSSAKVWGLVTLFNSVCWTPFTAFNIGIGIGVSYTTSELIVMNWLAFLGMFNSIMNPFIFAWHRQDFNKSLKKLFRVKEQRVDPVVGVNVATLKVSNTTTTRKMHRASTSHTTHS
ncbi:uncharacterized protein LOC128164879 [Crassostrea angulata]|uniref:uncharacterized protein LOC128164879 n=1 Tax=Magallana angulata TaxID=2784310 RepID=UPI0022B0B3FF|nr:uncharacterized protein LOC128164879 [Crassostrea angulata]